jgi:hypothetical protein
MAATYVGSSIVCAGTTVISTPVDLDAIQNNATTSFTISKGATTILSGGAGVGATLQLPLRSAGGLTVTVVGGGTVTLLLAVSARR